MTDKIIPVPKAAHEICTASWNRDRYIKYQYLLIFFEGVFGNSVSRTFSR